ncbi:transposase [Synechococcales cyanobacterium C]|uniref:Transposase n=1 Tax=Petrachloros mirabilis ULC683 TaxID=2781853 RepID=A0A8K2A2C5_9CYAN|nr:transposase [Petrachloros mirabilis]NCJ08257.1 transposase [Petrachloros mirabilis ULC683]
MASLPLGRRRRKLLRLQDYDYTRSGAYFVTICVKDRVCLFGEVVDGEMHPNAYGEIVQAVWDGLPDHYDHVVLDAFVVMPNHIHSIIILDAETTTISSRDEMSKRHGLSEIVRAFKTFSARRINELRQCSGVPVWQRNYYEHIIRNEESLNRIRGYITENPIRWSKDREGPNNPAVG